MFSPIVIALPAVGHSPYSCLNHYSFRNADLTEANLMLARMQRDRFEQEKVLTASVQEAEAGLKLATVQRDRLKRALHNRDMN